MGCGYSLCSNSPRNRITPHGSSDPTEAKKYSSTDAASDPTAPNDHLSHSRAVPEHAPHAPSEVISNSASSEPALQAASAANSSSEVGPPELLPASRALEPPGPASTLGQECSSPSHKDALPPAPLQVQLLDATCAPQVLQEPVRGNDATANVVSEQSAQSAESSAEGPPRSALPRVNKYTMLEVIGKGAYGKVRRCIDESACELRAVKILPKSFLKRKRVGRFGTAFDGVQKEIAVWKKLDHRNIVKLHEVIDDESADKLYMVGEYISGGAVMPDCTECPPLPGDIARVLTAQLVEALSYLHFQGIAHRDIKPGNLLFETVPLEEASSASRRKAAERARDAALTRTALGRVDSGEEEIAETHHSVPGDTIPNKFAGVDPSRVLLKVTDFGVSQIFSADGDDSSRTTAGTAAFLAPEMLTGDSFSGKAADIYALGVTLYMFLYGRPPFLADTVSDLYEMIKHAPVPWPDKTAVNTDVDRDAVAGAKDLILRLMDRNPATRMTLDEARLHPFLVGYAGPVYQGDIITVTPAEVRLAVSSVVRFRAMVQAAVVGKKKLLAVRRKLAAMAAMSALSSQVGTDTVHGVSGLDVGPASTKTTHATELTESSIAYSTAAAADLTSMGILQEGGLVVGQPRYEIVTETAE